MRIPFDERDRRSVLHDLASADAEARRLAVERVVALPAQEAIALLVERLGDPSWRVRKAAVERLVDLSHVDACTARLIAALADGENPGRRNAAVEALVRCGAPVVPQLVAAASSCDADVRKLVIDTLAGIGDPSAEEALVAGLADRDSNVRAAAADALGAVGGPDARRALRRLAARADEEQLVRLSALRALALLDAPVPSAELSPLLEDPILRPAALELLGSSEDATAPMLLKWLGSDSRTSRMAAVRALLRLLARCDGHEAAGLLEQIRDTALALPVVEDAIAALSQADLAVQLVAVHFLGIVRDPRVVVPILRAAQDEALRETCLATLEELGAVAESALDAAWPELDATARRDACRLLGLAQGESSAARLLVALEAGSPELRIEATRAIARRGLAAALPILLRRLEQAAEADDAEGEEERVALTEALVSLAGVPAQADPTLDLLASRLGRAGEGGRLAIATVLGRVGRTADIATVTLLLKDPSAEVRRAAVEALARLDPGTAPESLRLALGDETAEVRMAAVTALGSVGSDSVLDDLERLADDADPRVRAAAIRAVGRRLVSCPDAGLRARALGRLDVALDDAGLVALAAVEALREIGGPAARGVARVFERPEPELAREAVACLAEHGDADDLAPLVGLLGHAEWSVRAEAIAALAERRCLRAVPAILRRLETEQDEFVRAAILRALQRLEG